MLSRRMLSREEEEEIGEEKEVRKVDQERINRFSRIHSRQKALDDELKARQKEKEDLEEISTELELADEDDKVPYATTSVAESCMGGTLTDDSYKIGDTFFNLPVAEVQELLSSSVENIDGEVTKLEERVGELTGEMQDLKDALYGRFGRSINLEA